MTAVLVDTSVWRRFFSGDAAVKDLANLLDEPAFILLHPWVLGELVLGGLSQREARLMERLQPAPVVSDRDVLEFVRRRRLARQGIGWADAQLLASALTASARLWSVDTDLAAAARAAHAAYPGNDTPA